jgi:VWFA-related protein
LRADVRLVVVDVSVTDSNGAPAKGLKAGDFQLKEDGNLQKIAAAEEHAGLATAAQTPRATPGPDGTISASNKPVANAGIWNVLLFDQFNTTREDQAAALRQLKQFVKQLPPDQPVALVAMTSQIKILSSLDDGAGGVARILDKNGLAPSASLEPANIVGSGPPPSSPDVQAGVDVERQAQHAQKTLDNFSALARWLTSYPGRKNVYWLTGGFPLEGQPFGVAGYTQLTPTGPANHNGQAIPMQEKTDKELEAARVAIYPIDASGVAPPEIVGETSANTQGNLLSIGKLGDKSIDVKKDDQLKAAQATEMQAIASATGGVASFNNDIVKALQDDFKRGGGYYAISYTPTDTAWNGAYRKIHLAVEQPGYQLTYRQGYYAKDPQAPAAPTNDEFRMALRRGSPPESAVLFSAKVSKAADSVSVEYAIESQTLRYQPDASGKLAANADCAVVAYDSNGKIVGTSLIQFSSSVSPEQRAALANGTIHAKQTVAVKGEAASLMLGVRDETTGSFGNLAVALTGNQ